MSRDAPIGRTGIPNWDIYDLDSKPDDSLLELPKDTEGYYLNTDGERVAFKGNRELVPAYNYFPLNEYHIQEIIKCRNDLRYFMYNYVKVLTGKGYQTPDLRDYQMRYLFALLTNNLNVLSSGRQSGKSTTTGIKVLWSVNFYENVPVGIAANMRPGAEEVLDRIKKMFNSLPIWLQQGVVSWNKRSIELENGSKVQTSATHGDAFRGFSFVGGEGHATLIVDECAHIGQNVWDEFADSVMPTVSSDPNANITLISTPKGYNHWYDIVQGARAGTNGYRLTEVAWDEIPGRDEAWKKKIIAKDGYMKFAQNYACAFLGSSATLINATGLQVLKDGQKEPIESTGAFRIYKQPEKDTKYLLTVDLASGTGYGDFTAVHVIKLKKRGFEQVAVFHANDVPLLRMTSIIYEIAKNYNNAYVFFEINYGEEVASRLYRDLEYENILTIANRNGKQSLMGFRGTWQVGLKTTRKTKAEMLVALKTLIESKRLKIADAETINEFFLFVAKGESYAAEEGSHDDLVMSLALLGWLVAQQTFKDIISYDFVEDYTSEAEDSEFLPLSMFSDSYDSIKEDDIWLS